MLSLQYYICENNSYCVFLWFLQLSKTIHHISRYLFISIHITHNTHEHIYIDYGFYLPVKICQVIFYGFFRKYFTYKITKVDGF